VIHPVQEDHTMPTPLSADVRSRFRRLYDQGLSGRKTGRGKLAPYSDFLNELVH
jgi:hypothetical protein